MSKTIFEKITKNEKELVEFMSNIVTCNLCPVYRECSRSESCKEVFRHWLASECKE